MNTKPSRQFPCGRRAGMGGVISRVATGARPHGFIFPRAGVDFCGNGVPMPVNGAGLQRNGAVFPHNGVGIRVNGVNFPNNGAAIRGNGVTVHFNGVALQINGVRCRFNGVAVQYNGANVWNGMEYFMIFSSADYADYADENCGKSAFICEICGFKAPKFVIHIIPQT